MIHAPIGVPRLGTVLMRERLFRRLDASATHPVTWISGPPGAGKTVLAASWVSARGHRAVWLQLEALDEDLGRFFQHLGAAAELACPGRGAALPVFGPEYLPGIRSFARNFFRSLFGTGAGCLLVIDDLHAVAPEHPLHTVIAVGVEALPSNGRAILMSRAGPPAAWARLRAASGMAVLPASLLALEPAEIDRWARLQGRELGAETIAPVHALTGGWAAGVALMLDEQPRGDGAGHGAGIDAGTRPWGGPSGDHVSVPEVVFDYLAAEVFAQLEPRQRRTLARLGALPLITARAATEVTGDEGAIELVRDLHRRAWFVVEQTPGCYALHALFAKFLQSRARRDPDQASAVAALGRAAAVLIDEGFIDEGIELQIACGGMAEPAAREETWLGIAGSLLARAPALLGRGRHLTLARWLERIPDDIAGLNPWVHFWRGMALFGTDLEAALAPLGWAADAFAAQGDRVGACHALTALVQCHVFLRRDLRPLDALAGELAALIPDGWDFPSPELEASVASTFVTLRVMRDPGAADMSHWIERTHALIERFPGPTARVNGLVGVVIAELRRGDVQRFERTVTYMKQAAAAPDAMPIAAHTSAVFEAYARYLSDPAAALAVACAGSEHAHEHGLVIWNATFELIRAGCALSLDRLDEAEELLERLAPGAASLHTLDRMFYLATRAWQALARDDFATALHWAGQALAEAHLLGSPSDILQWSLPAVLACIHLAPKEQVAGEIERLLAETTAAGLAGIEVHYLFAAAELHLHHRDERTALAFLDRALGRASAIGLLNTFVWRARPMRALLALALAAGLHVGHARKLIALHELAPPELRHDLVAWPWRLSVRVLGGLALDAADGRAVAIRGPTQAALVEALSISPDGFTPAGLMDRLWAEADGDRAHTSLNTNVHRLRKSLGDPGAILVSERRIRWAPDVWVDAWAVESAATRLAQRPIGAHEVDRLEAVAALRVGPFAGDGQLGELAIERAREIDRCAVQVLVALAEHHVASGRPLTAIRQYERALAIEPVSELLYRGLIAAYLAAEDRSGASLAYRRCEETLARVLGTSPSDATRVLVAATRR